jgi:hypothetical protein
MSVDVREWMPDIFQYKLTFLYIVVQLLAVTRWPRGLGAQPSIRSAADMTWFMPVFVWGLESLHHLCGGFPSPMDSALASHPRQRLRERS